MSKKANFIQKIIGRVNITQEETISKRYSLRSKLMYIMLVVVLSPAISGNGVMFVNAYQVPSTNTPTPTSTAMSGVISCTDVTGLGEAYVPGCQQTDSQTLYWDAITVSESDHPNDLLRYYAFELTQPSTVYYTWMPSDWVMGNRKGSTRYQYVSRKYTLNGTRYLIDFEYDITARYPASWTGSNEQLSGSFQGVVGTNSILLDVYQNLTGAFDFSANIGSVQVSLVPIVGTPTATPITYTPTATSTLTFTPTNTPTFTPTNTPTITPTFTATNTFVPGTPHSNGSGTCWESGASWETYTVYYDIDETIFPIELSLAEWVGAIEASAQTWNNVSPSGFTFVRQNGNINIITYQIPNDPTNIAAAKPAPDTGFITSGYIKINPTKLFDVNNIPAPGTPGNNGSIDTYNLQNVVTHEFGHWLFLEDINNSNCTHVTMDWSIGYGELVKINLEAADIDAINWQYP